MTELTTTAGRVTREDSTPEVPKVGEWYRVREKDYKGKVTTNLRCVTHVGSNYVELTSVGDGDLRVHVDEFSSVTEPAPDALQVIKGYIEEHRVAVYRLMDEARQITARLGVSPQALTDGTQNEGQALTRTVGTGPMKDYKKALEKAKKEQLPKIFEKIRDHNDQMATWMKAELIPLKAEAEQLKPCIEAIETRIFNVELYAGLVEEIVQVRDSAPAAPTEKVHLFQRRAYMDEECLLHYTAGGMDFDNLKDFDAWMAQPEHAARLLPHPRCIQAFRVRRRTKERDFPSLSAFIAFAFGHGEENDKTTYLYMRNGEQIYRLRTSVEFTEELFPDLDARQLDGVLYAKMFGGRVEHLITEGEYAELQRLHDEKEVELAAKHVAFKKASKAEQKKIGWISDYNQYSSRISNVEKYHPDSVYFDDMTEYVQKQILQHNRIALLLQGLFDRSPVFHPHPVWQVWTPDGFAQSVELVYDQSRALAPSATPPDFEAYRARLNATIKVGSYTVGQDDYWQEVEAKRENAKYHSGGRHYDYQRYKPYGDHGPGYVARVVAAGRKACTFKWEKEASWRTVQNRRNDWRYRGDVDAGVPRSIAVPKDRLLHVDAYTPGDFHVFFDDPRTRQTYLQWAPYLLAAEDWHAGWTRNPDGRRVKR